MHCLPFVLTVLSSVFVLSYTQICTSGVSVLQPVVWAWGQKYIRGAVGIDRVPSPAGKDLLDLSSLSDFTRIFDLFMVVPLEHG